LLFKERWLDLHLGHICFVDAKQAQADCKVKSERLSAVRGRGISAKERNKYLSPMQLIILHAKG
jgi:hypothetical protein